MVPVAAGAEAGKDKNDKSENEAGQSNIIVAVRLRPESEQEYAMGMGKVAKQLDEHVIVFDPPDGLGGYDESANRLPGTHRYKDQQYAFDRVFATDASQYDVYEATAKNLIPSVVNGYNATVFAYGATGAGKTYTMLGNSESGPGVMMLTMQDLFKAVDQQKKENKIKITMSYLEVYNETIRDLLVAEDSDEDHGGAITKGMRIKAKQGLLLQEDPLKGMVVSGISEHHPKYADDVVSLLEQGNLRRTQHPTDANATSSRSHAVLQILVSQQDLTSGTETTVRVGKLSLIDLAGSERAARTKNTGARLVEGANINRSLLALGNCINALCKNLSGAHVPYRDSKLTRLLKDSLGGNCKTCMIANISQSRYTSEDTHNTLKYANRAKNIKCTVKRNVLSVNYHIKEYTRVISDQRSILNSLKSENESLKAELEKLKRSRGAVNSNDQADQKSREEFAALKKEAAANLSERKRYYDSLLQTQDQERETTARLKSKEHKLTQWKKMNPDVASSDYPVSIVTVRRDLRGLREKESAITQQKRRTMDNLEENAQAMQVIKNKYSHEVDHIKWIEQEMKTCKAEIENMKLKHHNQLFYESQRKQHSDMQLLQQNIEPMVHVLKKQYSVLVENELATEDMQNSYAYALRMIEKILPDHKVMEGAPRSAKFNRGEKNFTGTPVAATKKAKIGLGAGARQKLADQAAGIPDSNKLPRIIKATPQASTPSSIRLMVATGTATPAKGQMGGQTLAQALSSPLPFFLPTPSPTFGKKNRQGENEAPTMPERAAKVPSPPEHSPARVQNRQRVRPFADAVQRKDPHKVPAAILRMREKRQRIAAAATKDKAAEKKTVTSNAFEVVSKQQVPLWKRSRNHPNAIKGEHAARRGAEPHNRHERRRVSFDEEEPVVKKSANSPVKWAQKKQQEIASLARRALFRKHKVEPKASNDGSEASLEDSTDSTEHRPKKIFKEPSSEFLARQEAVWNKRRAHVQIPNIHLNLRRNLSLDKKLGRKEVEEEENRPQSAAPNSHRGSGHDGKENAPNVTANGAVPIRKESVYNPNMRVTRNNSNLPPRNGHNTRIYHPQLGEKSMPGEETQGPIITKISVSTTGDRPNRSNELPPWR